MEQRPLRLGDIVDDYCPRERRITNHVIVALVDDAIRQTRCGTCDTEHVYKAARLPRRRSKDEPPEHPGQLVSRSAADAPVEAPPPAVVSSPPQEIPRVATMAAAPPAPSNGAAAAAPPEMAAAPASEQADDVWPAHRRLIRATLPRVEGEEKTPRPIPEFTMHQRQGRGGNGYRGDYWANGNGNGNGNARGNGSGNGNANGGGFRHGQPGPRQPGSGGGGGKRWRRRRGRGGPKAN